MKTKRSEQRDDGGAQALTSLTSLLIAPIFLFALAGCEVFEVTNPGRILDEDLNTLAAMQNLITGMSSDFSVMNAGSGGPTGGNGVTFVGSRATDEMAGAGSYPVTSLLGRGIILPEDMSGEWENLHRARFNAVDGIRRMQEVMGSDFQGSELAARANLFAAMNNVKFGENWCRVAYDGGPAQPKSAAFERAIEWADRGLQHASSPRFVNALSGTKAQAYVGLGDWDSAVEFSSGIPTDFVEHAVHSDNSNRERQVLFFESTSRFEVSAYQTPAHEVWMATEDPRVPMIDCAENVGVGNCTTDNAADGITPMVMQLKFPNPGDDYPVVSGKEMRLIEAEAALRDGDPAAAIARLNELRTLWEELDSFDPDEWVPQYTGATSFDESDPLWELLDQERYLTLWLEGKRLFDLHRWDHPFLDGGQIVHEPEPRRDSCIPIGRSEILSNENISAGGG